MKKIITLIVLAACMASCTPGKTIVHGKNNKLVWGNPRLIHRDSMRKEMKLRRSEFDNKITAHK